MRTICKRRFKADQGRAESEGSCTSGESITTEVEKVAEGVDHEEWEKGWLLQWVNNGCFLAVSSFICI